jgi:hypothetical protein
VLARFPRRERASRRANTRSRLGLLTAVEDLRLAAGELLLRRTLCSGGAEAGMEMGAGADGFTTATSVRAGRASATERTLMGAELKRPSAFLPPLVRALRRSSAASRLDVLAITTREVENLEEQNNRSADQVSRQLSRKTVGIRGEKPPAHRSDESVATSLY